MSYEYKESIKDAVNEVYSASFTDELNRKYELDHVYAQAAKADEYEAKAKAFDEIMKAYDEAFSREHMAGEVSNIIEKYESGDNNE